MHISQTQTHSYTHTCMTNVGALCGQSRWGQMGRQRGGASLRQDVPGCSKTCTFLNSCSPPFFFFLSLCSFTAHSILEITNRWTGDRVGSLGDTEETSALPLLSYRSISGKHLISPSGKNISKYCGVYFIYWHLQSETKWIPRESATCMETQL